MIEYLISVSSKNADYNEQNEANFIEKIHVMQLEPEKL